MDAGVGVEPRDRRQQLALLRVSAEEHDLTLHPDLAAAPGLVPDVDLRGRVLTHQEHDEPRSDAPLSLQPLDARRGFRADGDRRRLSVEDAGDGHGWGSLSNRTS